LKFIKELLLSIQLLQLLHKIHFDLHSSNCKSWENPSSGSIGVWDHGVLIALKKKTVLLCINLNLDTTTRESFVPSNSSALTPFFLVEWVGVCVCDDDPSSLVSVVIVWYSSPCLSDQIPQMTSIYGADSKPSTSINIGIVCKRSLLK
jgi:hypothetical protein